MTFREEFEKKHPDAVRVARCPRDKKLMECDRTLICADCWDREIPKKRNSQKKENTTENLAAHTEQFICSKCGQALSWVYDEKEEED